MTEPHQSPAEEPRPWAQPGAVRRDSEPHRGRFLCVLGSASLACDMLALVFGACASSQSVMQFSPALQLVDCAAAPALLAAIGLGLAACLMARRDLRLMWQ